jgi:hypothetical protein
MRMEIQFMTTKKRLKKVTLKMFFNQNRSQGVTNKRSKVRSKILKMNQKKSRKKRRKRKRKKMTDTMTMGMSSTRGKVGKRMKKITTMRTIMVIVRAKGRRSQSQLKESRQSRKAQERRLENQSQMEEKIHQRHHRNQVQRMEEKLTRRYLQKESPKRISYRRKNCPKAWLEVPDCNDTKLRNRMIAVQ